MKKKMIKTISIILLVSMLFGGGYFWLNHSDDKTKNDPKDNPEKETEFHNGTLNKPLKDNSLPDNSLPDNSLERE